mgnify:CR=1 FL=1
MEREFDIWKVKNRLCTKRCGNTSQRQIGGTTLGRYTKLMQRAKEGEKFYVHSINNRWK